MTDAIEGGRATDRREYRVYGVEHVNDAFDQYEQCNQLGPVSLSANSVADPLDQAAQTLQAAVNVVRQGFVASGTFSVEVIRVVDSEDYCIFQNSRSLRRCSGRQAEDASTVWANRKDVPFVSCFLSYNKLDEAFTKRLYSDLSRLRLCCWFAASDLRMDHLEPALTHAIERTDRMLIVLSDHSLVSQWVAFEAECALAKERAARSQLVFPILLDQAAVHSELL